MTASNTSNILALKTIAQDECKRLTREKYLSMPVVRFDTISKFSGASREQIESWRDEEGWVEQRDQIRNTKRSELTLELGEPEEIPKTVAKNCRLAMGKVEKAMSGSPTIGELVDLTKLTEKLYDLLDRAYAQLGLIK
ncbi:MAG TPA: hypothetical protein V6C76_12665 [Drouetiella sp.]